MRSFRVDSTNRRLAALTDRARPESHQSCRWISASHFGELVSLRRACPAPAAPDLGPLAFWYEHLGLLRALVLNLVACEALGWDRGRR